jgi:hypothetical protein
VEGNAVSCTEVVFDPFLALQNEPAGVHVEVGTRVELELPFTMPVSDERWAVVVVRYVPLLMSAALVSLLAVGAELSTLLRPGSEAAKAPAETGCSIISGGESAARAAVPEAGARVPGDEARVPENFAKAVFFVVECCNLAGEVLNLLQKCSAAWGGPTLASTDWGATSEMLSTKHCPRAGRREWPVR